MSGWKTLLSALAWPATGAAVGAALGAAWAGPSSFGSIAVPALLSVVLLMGGVVLVRRRTETASSEAVDPTRPPTTNQKKPSEAKPGAPTPPRVDLRLPEVEDGLPDVWGVGDTLRVEVVARDATGKPAQVLAGSRELAAGELDEDGRFVTAVRFDRAGQARLRAEAGGGRAERAVRIVDYGEEIVRRVDAFRVWAMQNVPGCRDALTIREVADAVAAAHSAQAGDDVVEIVRIYELVSYGERVADRALFVDAMRAFGRLDAEGVGRAPAVKEA